MGYMCIRSSKECDGCGACQEERYITCDNCGSEIYEGENYFKNFDEILCMDCLYEMYVKELERDYFDEEI